MLVLLFLVYILFTPFPTFLFRSYCRPYFRRRAGNLEGLALAAFLGVASGYYIFQPFFEEMDANRRRREALEAAGEASASTTATTIAAQQQPPHQSR